MTPIWTDDPNETLDNLCSHYGISRDDITTVVEEMLETLSTNSPAAVLMATAAILVAAASQMPNQEEALDTAVNLIDTYEDIRLTIPTTLDESEVEAVDDEDGLDTSTRKAP